MITAELNLRPDSRQAQKPAMTMAWQPVAPGSRPYGGLSRDAMSIRIAIFGTLWGLSALAHVPFGAFLLTAAVVWGMIALLIRACG